MTHQQSKTILYLIIGFNLILFVFFFATKTALAERLESNSYVIQFGNFNVTSGEKESANYNVTDTVGQTAAGPFGEYGSTSYFVGAGFQYIYQIDKFSFSISDININLGELTAGVHNSDTNVLSISTKGAGGYSIYAYEAHPLQHSNGTSNIADTTCDDGLCSQTGATVWSDQNIPGFGFNMTGSQVASDFQNSTYYRQFADQSLSEDAQVIMSSDNIVQNEKATVTYKAGISGFQDAGNYQTHIIFIAVPKY